MEHAIFNGIPYGMGDGVWEFTNATVEQDNNGPEAYGARMRIGMSLALMAELKIPDGPDNPITIVASCPPGVFNEVKKNIMRGWLNGEDGDRSGIWHVQLSTDRTPREYHIKQVSVIRQGVATFAAYIWDIMGNNVEEVVPYLDTRVDIIDLGYAHASTFTITNGVLNAESVEKATNYQGGIGTQIVEPALGILMKATGAAHLHPMMVDSWLKQWYAMSKQERASFTVKIGGKIIALDPVFAPLVRNYSNWVMRNLVQPALREGVKALMPTGGGWYFILPFLQAGLRAYPRVRLILPDMFEHTRGIPIHHLNGYGVIPAIMQAGRV